MTDAPERKPHFDTFAMLPEAKVALCLTAKAASSAIAQALARHYGTTLERPYHQNSVFAWWTLPQVRKYAGSYRTAMFVRNPYDRLVGCYEYHVAKTKLQMSKRLRDIGLRADMTFEEFLHVALKNPEADAHLCIQAWQLPQPDFLGRFEDLPGSWRDFAAWAGVKLPDLEVVNRTERDHYRRYYSDHWRDRVRRAYSVDFDSYGYEF